MSANTLPISVIHDDLRDVEEKAEKVRSSLAALEMEARVLRRLLARYEASEPHAPPSPRPTIHPTPREDRSDGVGGEPERVTATEALLRIIPDFGEDGIGVSDLEDEIKSRGLQITDISAHARNLGTYIGRHQDRLQLEKVGSGRYTRWRMKREDDSDLALLRELGID